jgi:ribose/xylose/arabinose/galactoside ABC-type transport system permease subunit
MNKILGILMLLVFACVATTMLSEGTFVSPRNIQNIMRWSGLFGIIGIGVAFVIITGGIDLSIGSMIGLIGCLMSMALMDWGFGITGTLVFIMIISVLLGLSHGLLVTKAGLQPFVVTLCGLLIYRGVARWITGDQTGGFGSEYNDSLRLLATGKPFSVATVLAISGLGGACWVVWNFLRKKQQLRDIILGLAVCIVVAMVGASRFTNLSTPTIISLSRGTSVEIITMPNDTQKINYRKMQMGRALDEQNAGHRPSALLPEILLNYVGYLTLAAFGWVTFLAVKTNGRAARKSLLVLGFTFLGVLLSQSVIGDKGPQWFGQSTGGELWNSRLDMLIVFVALAALIFGINQFIKSTLKHNPSAKLALLITGVLAGCWLMSQTPICRTLVPAPMIFLIVIAVIATIFLNHTIYGRYLLALGNNETATKLSGINTDRMVILAYVICGACTGVGAVLFALDLNSIQPAGHGNFYELYAIAAAVLGGCSLRGGEGSITGVVIGAAVMRVLYNSINILKIPNQLEFAIIGTVILVGVLADETLKRMNTRKQQLG